MSEQRTSPSGVPEVTLGWRLKMALGSAGMTVQEMADETGMSRQQLSRYLNDKGERPRRAILVTWALRTGVPVEWLVTGTEPTENGPEGTRVQENALGRCVVHSFPVRSLVAA